MENKLKAGVSRKIITPEIGSLMMGYMSRPAESVHDDLFLTANAFSYGETEAMLIAADVCLINNDLINQIRSMVSEAVNIPAEHIIISASHTHSGPYTEKLSGRGTVDLEYCERIFIPRCVSAAEEAVKSAEPVKMGVSSVKSLAGINRRQIMPDDTVKLGQNPWGPHDPNITVISFINEDKKPVLNLIHYGAHCTASGINKEITRDWAGVMTDYLENETGAVTVYLSGAGGDVAPRMANGRSAGTGISCASEVGYIAAADAVRAYKSIPAYYDENSEVKTGDLKIPYEPPMPLDEARDLLKSKGSEPGMMNSSLTELIKMYENGDMGCDDFIINQTMIKIGPVVFVPFPFETFSEISLRLRTYGRFGHILLLGCANGSNSYLPTRDQISRKGYEVDSFKWARPRRLPDDTDFLLIKQNLKLMEDF